MSYNTGNPVPSKDPRDLVDNAENLDRAVNGDDATWTDRLGRERKSWRGMENDFSDFLANSGYQLIGDYAPGIEITAYNQIVRDGDGEFWRLSGQTELPYVTTGAGLPEGGAFVAVGDAALRQELASPYGAAMVGLEDGLTLDIVYKNWASVSYVARQFAPGNTTATALQADIDSAIASGAKRLVISRGSYDFAQAVTVSVTSSLEIDFSGANIRYTGTDHVQHVLRMNAAGALDVARVEVDGANKSSFPLIIVGPDVFSDHDCNLIGVVAKGSDPGPDSTAAACWVAGGFRRVTTDKSCEFKDVTSDGERILRGLFVGRLQTGADAVFPLSLMVVGSKVANIYGTGVGAEEGDGVFYQPVLESPRWGETSLRIVGAEFRNCSKRALKCQGAGGVFTGNKVFRDQAFTLSSTTQPEIDFQYGGGTAYDNDFYYPSGSFAPNTIFMSFNRDKTNPSKFYDNRIHVGDDIAIENLAWLQSNNDAAPLFGDVVADNMVNGRVKHLLQLRASGTAPMPCDQVSVERNKAFYEFVVRASHNQGVNSDFRIVAQSNINASPDQTQRFLEANGASITVLSPTSESSVQTGTGSSVAASRASSALGNYSAILASDNSSTEGPYSAILASDNCSTEVVRGVTLASLRTVNPDSSSVAGGHGGAPGSAPSSANRKWQLSSVSGNLTLAGTLSSSSTFADYAEYFENQVEGVIPLGTIVALVGDRVRIAQDGDEILGVISGTAAIAAGDTPFTWHGRYVVGEFGEPLYETVPDPDWVPVEGESESDRPLIQRRIENPDYDPELPQIPRSQRPAEWSCVGLLGRVYVRVGADVVPGAYVGAAGGRSERATRLRCMAITSAYDAVAGYAVALCLLR